MGRLKLGIILIKRSFFLQIYFDVIEEIDCIIDKHVCTVILKFWECSSEYSMFSCY